MCNIFTAEVMSKYKESRSTRPGFTLGELKINAFLCDSLRQFSFSSRCKMGHKIFLGREEN